MKRLFAGCGWDLMVKALWRGAWYEVLAALLSLMSGDGAFAYAGLGLTSYM